MPACPATPSRPTAARPALRGHRCFVVELRHGDEQPAFFALAGDNDLAVLAAGEQSFEGVKLQIAARSFSAVAAEARSLQERTNVFGVGDAWFI